MKRSQPETSGEPPTKKQVLTKLIPSVNIGSVSTEDEMNLKVLQFQNKKLCERLEELKTSEEKLTEQIHNMKEKRDSDFAIISVINRHWMQLDEDIKTILQRFEGVVEEDSEQTSNEATLSYLDYLANIDSEQVAEELVKRSNATKEHTRKLLHYVEMSGPFTSRTVEEKLEKESQIAAEKEGSKDENQQEQQETTVSDSHSAESTKSDLGSDNKQLRELVTSLHQKQQTTSLEFSEIRDKYALAQKEIAQLNTQVQDASYDLQKANHRVANLVKRLNELEDINKRLREGTTTPGEPGEGGAAQSDEVSLELEDLRDLAKTRLEELEKVNENFITSQQELEKLKLEMNNMSESSVLQSAPYKCLQSQFSVLYGEVTQLRQQLDDTRRVLSTTKTQHVLQLEQVESNNVTIQKKYKAEVSELHDALLQVKRDYDLLRMEFEQNLKANEQTGPMTKEMSHMINSLQSHNQQLKVEVSRYKRKFSEAQVQVVKLSEELKKVRESDNKAEPTEELSQQESQTNKDEPEPKMSKPEEEGEIEDGEETAATSKSNDLELKELRETLKKSQETQKEMKLVLDVYKGAAKDLRDKVELLTEEKRLKEQIEEQKNRIENLEKELEKHKGALADEEAIHRLKMAEETIEQLQKNLAATKQEEDAVLAEMEFTGQAFEEMQEQNVRLLQQLREKDDANLKLMSERIKGNQIQKQIREEMDVLSDHVTSLNTHRETQTQLVKKLEEREKALQNAVTSLEKELNLRQQAMELHKRKAIESAQAAQDMKIRFDLFQQQFQEAQDCLSEQTRASEEEAFKSRRIQEECANLKRRLEKEKKNVLYGAADEILLEEIKQYKAKLTCPCCNTRKKDAILTKCFHVFCFECLKTRYDTRQRKCPKCNATFGNNDFHRIYL
ncbi:E3 ubiquitin-protein ligase Bre1-like [Stylophora pistillata]|uniref:E3 ubiquitin protein ligase n=1 Tax=Stylophora pistillata TaxID=50429 RepID=A0A2B4RWL9_STYPI|nr:E3 ubiquitin-protein ligase Bre1-like [Stylophora pistillata]PFX20960.1 E3 ubiquitin-protein ligase BRE1B [Stylophora pistillata]